MRIFLKYGVASFHRSDLHISPLYRRVWPRTIWVEVFVDGARLWHCSPIPSVWSIHLKNTVVCRVCQKVVQIIAMSQLQDSDYRCLHRGPWLAPDLDSLDICAPILLNQYIYICTVIGQCWGMAVAYRCKNKIRVWLSSMIDKRISVTRSSGTLCSSGCLNFSFLFYRGGRWLRGLVVFCLLSCILPKLCFYTMVSSSNNRCCSVASSYLHTPLRVLHNICFFLKGRPSAQSCL